MSNPLTWRNVSSSSFDDVFKGRALAQAQATSASNNFEDIVKQAQTIENANYTQTGVNNSETLKAMLYGAKTPEAMQALQASGDYERARAAMGANVSNPEELAAMAEGRLGKLQTQALANQQYTDNKQAVEDRMPEAMFRTALMNARSPEEAKNIQTAGQAAFGNGSFSPKAAMSIQQYALDREQNIVNQGRATTEFGFKEAAEAQKVLTRPLEIQGLQSNLLTAAAQRAASAASAEASRNSVAVSQGALEDRRKANEAALRQASNMAALKDTMYQDGVYSNNDAPELIKLMTDSGIGSDVGERNAIIKRLTEIQAKGIDVETQDADGKKVKTTVPLSKSAVKAALLGSDDQWFNSYNQGWANNIENALKKAMTTPRIDKIDGKSFVKSDAVDGYMLYQELLRNNIEDPVPAATKGSKPFKR